MNIKTEINDGGPAFPSQWDDKDETGMTLRDWFAGQALAGMCGHPLALAHVSDQDLGADAELMYRLADAMIAARKGGAA